MHIAYVFNESLDADDRDVLDRILRAAEYEPTYDVPTDISSIDKGTTIGVVALPIASTDAAIVDRRTQAFGGAGIRVVGIWLPKGNTGNISIPECLEKYGSALVGSESENLIDTLSGKNDAWEEPNGKSRPTPPMTRNRC